MPGPKMGPRPPDFNEEEVKKAPTWRKWLQTPDGETLRYACRDFVKGDSVDEEKLMRRIMITRRNNIKDHETLKWARELAAKQQKSQEKNAGQPKVKEEKSEPASGANQDGKQLEGGTEKIAAVEASSTSKPAVNVYFEKKRNVAIFSDAQIAEQMDVPAVEATRSYQAWMALKNGEEFVYNQKFIKGKKEDDWTLRKNIWRRMRYRRENKKMMDEVLKDEKKLPRKKRVPKPKAEPKTAPKPKKPPRGRGAKRKYETAALDSIHEQIANNNHGVPTASQIVDHALMSTPAGVIAVLHQANMQQQLQEHQQQHQQQHHHTSLESAAAEAAASIPPDPDTAAVVEAAVAAGESYAISPYMHNPLDSSVDGLGLALDAAARLAAAKAVAMETDAAALAAAVAEHHHPPLPQQALAQQGMIEQEQHQLQHQHNAMGENQPSNEQVDQDDVRDYRWDGGNGGHCG